MEREGYKLTELGWLPKKWSVLRVGELYSFISTNSYSRNDLDYRSSDIHNIHYGDIHSTFTNYVLDLNEFYSIVPVLKGHLTNKDYQYLEDGDLILADASEDYLGIGKCVELKNVGDRKVISGLHTIALRLKERKVALGFGSAILNIPYVNNLLLKKATGVSVFGISKKTIENFKIPIPPLPEQKAIVDFLTIWDKAISTQDKLVKAKILRQKALMQQLLTGKKRLPGFRDEWDKVSLGDIFKRVVTKNAEQNTNVVTISAEKGFIKQGDFFKKAIASEILDNYYLVSRGDFCYNRSYSNGYPLGAIKRLNSFDKAVVTTLYMCFRLSDEDSSADYYHQYFNANMLDKGLIKIAQEGGRAHGLLNVGVQDFFDLKIDRPSLEEQTAIAEVLGSVEQEVLLEKKKLRQLKLQKKGVMQQLLTGKKRLV